MDEKTAKVLDEVRKAVAQMHGIDENKLEMTVNCRADEVPPNAEDYDWCGDFEDEDIYGCDFVDCLADGCDILVTENETFICILEDNVMPEEKTLKPDVVIDLTPEQIEQARPLRDKQLEAGSGMILGSLGVDSDGKTVALKFIPHATAREIIKIALEEIGEKDVNSQKI